MEIFQSGESPSLNESWRAAAGYEERFQGRKSYLLNRCRECEASHE